MSCRLTSTLCYSSLVAIRLLSSPLHFAAPLARRLSPTTQLCNTGVFLVSTVKASPPLPVPPLPSFLSSPPPQLMLKATEESIANWNKWEWRKKGGGWRGRQGASSRGPVTSAALGAMGREGEGDEEARAGAKPGPWQWQELYRLWPSEHLALMLALMRNIQTIALRLLWGWEGHVCAWE